MHTTNNMKNTITKTNFNFPNQTNFYKGKSQRCIYYQ